MTPVDRRLLEIKAHIEWCRKEMRKCSSVMKTVHRQTIRKLEDERVRLLNNID